MKQPLSAEGQRLATDVHHLAPAADRLPVPGDLEPEIQVQRETQTGPAVLVCIGDLGHGSVPQISFWHLSPVFSAPVWTHGGHGRGLAQERGNGWARVNKQTSPVAKRIEQPLITATGASAPTSPSAISRK